VNQAGPTARADGLRPPVPSLHGRLILIVDDVELVARTTALLLQTLGARAATATTAAEARRAVEAEAWDLVLDLEIPGVVGTALKDELRARRPGVPIVVVSGHPGEAAGPLDARTRFLRKPFGLDELLTAVEAALA
jgi:CheY-like chemotaxis protein